MSIIMSLKWSGLLFLPGFALTKQDYDCMLETVVCIALRIRV